VRNLQRALESISQNVARHEPKALAVPELMPWLGRAGRIRTRPCHGTSKHCAPHGREAECIGKSKASNPYELSVKVSTTVDQQGFGNLVAACAPIQTITIAAISRRRTEHCVVGPSGTMQSRRRSIAPRVRSASAAIRSVEARVKHCVPRSVPRQSMYAAYCKYSPPRHGSLSFRFLANPNTQPTHRYGASEYGAQKLWSKSGPPMEATLDYSAFSDGTKMAFALPTILPAHRYLTSEWMQCRQALPPWRVCADTVNANLCSSLFGLIFPTPLKSLA